MWAKWERSIKPANAPSGSGRSDRQGRGILARPKPRAPARSTRTRRKPYKRSQSASKKKSVCLKPGENFHAALSSRRVRGFHAPSPRFVPRRVQTTPPRRAGRTARQPQRSIKTMAASAPRRPAAQKGIIDVLCYLRCRSRHARSRFCAFRVPEDGRFASERS